MIEKKYKILNQLFLRNVSAIRQTSHNQIQARKETERVGIEISSSSLTSGSSKDVYVCKLVMASFTLTIWLLPCFRQFRFARANRFKRSCRQRTSTSCEKRVVLAVLVIVREVRLTKQWELCDGPTTGAQAEPLVEKSGTLLGAV